MSDSIDKTSRRKTDWWCTRCTRVLRNEPALKQPSPADTVSPRFDQHDGCGGGVVA